MEVRIVTCASRKGMRTWMKLERALLLAFREKYGAVPMCNGTGKNMRWQDEETYFSRKRITAILNALA